MPVPRCYELRAGEKPGADKIGAGKIGVIKGSLKKVGSSEIGAGHQVTAIYEITPVGSGAELNDPLRYGSDTPAAAVLPADEIGFLKMRYKAPEGDTSKLIETPITQALAVPTIEQASVDARWAAAVAAFGQKLKG